jgi:siroheme synthase (precorrin-2 oxidase/ferrochelatase)
MQIPDTVVLVSSGGTSPSLALTIFVAVAAALVSGVASYVAQERRLRAELQRQEREIQANLELQQQSMRTEFMAEQAVRALLSHRAYTKRKFKTIKRRLAGFEDNELRQILVRAGAVRFGGDGQEEVWGLIERNELK